MRLKSNLDEILYDRILESLIRGDYVMGQNVTLDEIAQKFEVSRTPVVQAVKQLANDGVFQIMSNGRIFVPEYDASSIRQICDVRQLIEGYALHAFMSRGGNALEEVLPQLELYENQCRQLEIENKHTEFALIDCKFHRTLVQASGNSALLQTYTRVQGRFTVVTYLVRPLGNRDFQKTIVEHDALIQAIRDKKTDQAQQCLRIHIEHSTWPLST